MLNNERIEFLTQMGDEFVSLDSRMEGVKFKVRPSHKINVHDIKSLRGSRYFVEYGSRSEWLDIEEITFLATIIAEYRRLFESLVDSGQPMPKSRTTMDFDADPSDNLILRFALRTAFLAPEVLN
jgi:hypothetical protein